MSRWTLLTMGIVLAAAVAAGEGKKTVRATVDADGVQRVALVGGSYYFSPDHVIVKAKVPVELSVKKEPGVVPHDFVVKAPEAAINISEKLTDTPKVIRFTPSKPGSYPMYCSKKLLFFESHRDKGMEGVLEVVE